MVPTPGNLVSTALDGAVAIVTLSNPPVNALHPEVFEALIQQLRRVQSNPDVRAIVLTGAGGKFCGGFDVNLFGTPAMEGLLDKRQEVLSQLTALLENGSKPTVAAIEGVALGGGLELAMCCNARVSAEGAQLGLPEVRLGLLPGLGGTQRLPRLVGMEQALNLMMSGQSIPAEDALTIGLVDEVVPAGELLPSARRLVLGMAAGKAPRRRTLQLTSHMQTSGDELAASVRALQDAEKRATRGLAGQVHYQLMLEAVAAGLAAGPAVGLQKEGEGFRLAARTRLHRLTLHLFRLHKSLRKERGIKWVLGQVHAVLGLLLMVIYVKLLVPYAFFTNLWASFRRGFAQGFRGKQQEKAGSATRDVGSSGASSSTKQHVAARKRR